jgi:hypothetical protein
MKNFTKKEFIKLSLPDKEVAFITNYLDEKN